MRSSPGLSNDRLRQLDLDLVHLAGSSVELKCSSFCLRVFAIIAVGPRKMVIWPLFDSIDLDK